MCRGSWIPASSLVRLVSADALEFWGRHVDPLFAVGRVRARVEAVQPETPRVRTLVLRPGPGWRGFHAGQHVVLTVEIDGRRLGRTFSLAGAESDVTLRLTVGRCPGGRVTGWLHERLRPGAVVELTQAQGEFTLPHGPAVPLLLIAGGTGITPFLAMLRTLAARGEHRDVVLLYYAPRAQDLIARRDLAALPARVPGLRVQRAYTRETRPGALAGRFGTAHLDVVAPDFRDRLTYVCGPGALMEAVERRWTEEGLAGRLRREWFAPPRRADAGGGPAVVTCAARGLVVTVPGDRSLLEELEAAGLRPRHGCRAGICRQCTCVKTSGAVQDLRTGRMADEAGEPIQLCAVRAAGDLTLAL
jgi:ferredoxin-NADP reductase